MKIGVSGALGRMGQTILRLGSEMKGIEIGGAYERPAAPEQGKPVGALLGLQAGIKLSKIDAATLEAIDVLIDFTEPKATLDAVAACEKAKKKIVIGTTGFSPAEIEKIRAAAQKIAIVISPNMSLGANLVFEIAKQVAQTLDDAYDIEITEAHHRQKKDAPSGTARRLAEKIAEGKGWKLDDVAVYGRKGLTGPRKPKEIGIHVIRAGEIVGDHSALFSGPGESIEIRHHASSRSAFAKGALLAAIFLADKPKGLYDMSDVLKSRTRKA